MHACAGRGITLWTEGDAEVIAHLYEDLGDDCVHELDGMFGLALGTGAAGDCSLVRDRLGIKPLHCARAGDQPWCSRPRSRRRCATRLLGGAPRR